MIESVEHPQLNVFAEADRIINGDREETYGDPSKNLARIAELWTTYLQAEVRQVIRRAIYLRADINLTDHELRAITSEVNLDLRIENVCRMMQLLKFARNENTYKDDNIIDDIGYAGLVTRCKRYLDVARKETLARVDREKKIHEYGTRLMYGTDKIEFPSEARSTGNVATRKPARKPAKRRSR